MQLITAVVAPSRIAAVMRGLRRFGLCGWNLSAGYAISEFATPMARLDMVAANADTLDVVRVIARAAQPTAPRIWVTPVDLVVRIRTGERGPDAVA